jgi:hypothetical protein
MTPFTKTPILLAALCFTACVGARFQPYSKTDEPLFAVLRELNKHPENTQALKELPVLYQQAVARHHAAIYSLSLARYYRRLDHIAYEEEVLQHINDAVRSVPAAFAIIKPIKNPDLTVLIDYYKWQIDSYWWEVYYSRPQEACNENQFP